MIVVDSSVWIDHLNEVETPQVREMRALVATDAMVGLTGVILTEVLRGISSNEEADLVERQLSGFLFLEMNGFDDHAEAARLFRRARSAGITLRNMADLLIATPCIREDAWLLHSDRDFDNLATVSDLKIWRQNG